MTHNDDDPGASKKIVDQRFRKNLPGLGNWLFRSLPGAYLGHLIDKATSSSITFMLIMTFLGIGVGYYNLVRHIEFEMLLLRIQKKHQRENPKPMSWYEWPHLAPSGKPAPPFYFLQMQKWSVKQIFP